MEATEVGKKKSQVGDGLAGEERGGRLTAGPSEVRCRGGAFTGVLTGSNSANRLHGLRGMCYYIVISVQLDRMHILLYNFRLQLNPIARTSARFVQLTDPFLTAT